jgi:recombination protein RecT
MNEKQIFPRNQVRDLIQSDQFKSAVAAALPQHLTPDRFARIALTALTRVPKLLECDKESVFKCMLQLSQFGLEPDGRNAHLIPFWNSNRKTFECQLIIDYKGLVDLAMRSGNVSYVHADKVCENDEFEFDKGQVKSHKIDFKEPRGEPYAYWAMVRNKDGTEQCEVMTRAEVDRIRARSKAKDSGPWQSDYDEMAKKTVFRRLSKWIQLSPEYRDALEADADRLDDLKFENAIPISRPVIEDRGASEGGAVEAEGQRDNATAGALPVEAAPSNPEPAPKKRTPLKRKNVRPVVRSVPPIVTAFLAALDSIKVSEADFIAAGLDNSWIDQTENSIPAISEEKLAEFLQPDSWGVIVDELEDRKKANASGN